jgi:methyl-accepting chemotaxis protein
MFKNRQNESAFVKDLGSFIPSKQRMKLESLKKRYLNLKLGPKLIGGFGAVLVLFVLVMLLYHYSVRYTLNKFKGLMEVEQAISEHSGKMSVFMSQALMEENNFLTSMDLKRTEFLNNDIAGLMAEAAIVEKLVDKSRDKDSMEKVKQIIVYAQAYKDNFDKVVEAMKVKGLDDKSGLRGEFNSIVNKFMDDMSLLEASDYYIESMRLEKFQAEYMLYKDGETAKQLDDILAVLKQYTEVSETNPVREMLNDIIREMIPVYQKAFQNLKGKGKGVTTADPDFKVMKESLANLIETLKQSYFKGAKAYALEIRKNEKDYLLTGKPEYAEATKKSVQSILDAIDKSSINPDYVKESNSTMKIYIKNFDTLVDINKKIDELKKNMRESVDQITPLVDSLNKKAQESAARKSGHMETLVNFRIGLAFLIGIGAIALGIGLSVIITRGITQPIVTTVAFAEKMANGDLSQKLEIMQNDEVGMLADALNGMVGNLHSMFSDIRTGIDDLTDSSSVLADISKGLLTGSEKTMEKSSFVLKASGKMSDNIGRAASTTRESADDMSFISHTTEEMNTSIETISRNTGEARKISDNAVKQAESATMRIKKLEKAALDIGQVTDTIRDISEQTNLLALNATIESSRAGEAGRGFAVVASEIKTLAQQSAQATREISQQIETVQLISKETMDEIREVAHVINTINTIVTSIADEVAEQARTSKDITSKITRSTMGVQAVNDMMKENSEMTSQITGDISDVADAAGEMTESSQKIDKNSEDLKHLAGRLKNMVDRFVL